MKTITSRQNAIFKRLRSAMREHDAEIVIEGPKQVADAIAAGWKPIVVAHRGGGPRASRDELVFEPSVFDSLAETKTPQNVIALFERPASDFADMLKRRDSIVVALDGVQDPGNVGTIIRLAAAFDCAGVALLPGSADAYSPKVIRSSAGAVLTVRIASATHEEVLNAGLPLFSASLKGKHRSRPPATRFSSSAARARESRNGLREWPGRSRFVCPGVSSR